MAPASAPVARFDDLRSGWSRELRHPVGVLAAGTMAEVPEVLRAAELAARQGNWVAGFVAYEAGAAFDPALPVRPGLQGPFAWFTVCATAAAVPPIDRLEASAPSVAALDRLGGSDWFRAGVTDIRGRIAAGDVYQVNLTDSFAAPFDGDPLALYAALARAQRGSYHAYLDLGGTVIASASPELFVRWTDGVLESRPMKGTRPRGPDAAADAALATELHASAKDRAENVMIVDLIRNDLSRLAELGSVEVPELFAIERYETVWQMTSTVRCRPRAEVGLADVFAAMFPCGSVTGAPKVAAMRIIDELEPFPRGPYCGAIGFLAPPAEPVRACFSVAIRTAVVDRAAGRVRYGAGGGITWDSDPVAEDAEAVAKTAILRHPRPVFRLLETMRAHDGEVLRWPLHRARLERAAAHFGYHLDPAVVEAALAEALPAGCGAERVRLTLGHDGDVAVERAAVEPASAVVRLVPAAGTMRHDDPFARFKTTWRAEYDLLRAAMPAGVDDVICVNERGEVTETTVANLLFRWDGLWYTPPRASGGLDGVGLAELLAGGQVMERVLRVEELHRCEALAVVSSLRGVRPAVLADGIDDGQGMTGGPHVVDANQVGAVQGGGTAGADGGGIPVVWLGGT